MSTSIQMGPPVGPLAPPLALPNSQGGWQDPQTDASIRQQLTGHIMNIFAKKRGQSMQNWGQRLHDFVRRLEEQLYYMAGSKEAYLDLSTLEHRLQHVARQLAPGNRAGSGNAGPPGNMPGAGQQQAPQAGGPQANGPSAGLPSGMVPTPGHPSGMVPTPGQPQGMMPTPGQPGGMVPTPGQPQGMVPTPGGPTGSMVPTPGGPQGMVPTPGQPQVPGVGGMGPGGGMMPMPFPGGPTPNPGMGMGPAGMAGFMPTPGANGMFGSGPDGMAGDMQHMRATSLPNGMGGPGGGPPNMGAMMPMMDGMSGPGNGMFGQAGMLRNGQQGMGFGMQNPQGGMGHGGPGPRTSMTGSMQGNGMIPVNNMGMPQQGPNPYNMGMGMGMGMGGPMGPQQPGGPPGPQPGMMGPGGMSDQDRQQYVQKQQRWLLFLRHCAKCRQTDSECQLQQQCKFGKQLWQHILHCSQPNCQYPRCSTSKDLLKHHQKCQSQTCPICAPVKEYVRKTRLTGQQPGAPGQGSQGPPPSLQGAPQGAPQPPIAPPPPQAGQPQGPQGSLQPPMPGMPNNNSMMMPGVGQVMSPYGPYPIAPAPPPPMVSGQKRPHSGMGQPYSMGPNGTQPGMGGPMPPGMPNMAPNMYNMPGGQPVDQQLAKRTKTGDDPNICKNTYTSLLETFSNQQIVHHKELIYQAAAQQRNTQAPPANQSDVCTVCHCTRLLYEPPVLYCSMCGLKIKRAQTYWSTPVEQQDPALKGCWCHQCYTEAKEKLPIFGTDGSTVRKADLVKRKNDEEIEEPWVQCDMCEAWVHQICGLFNKGRNSNNTHYLCPDCLIKSAEIGKRQRIEARPQSMLECKDLPHCELSKYLENRVLASLEHERMERAASEGKQRDEVPTAEGLTVRVINNVIKKCEVKPRFQDAFSGEGHPSAFPYRQRVLLLFQNLDGVDVCLFCMYVQEYGEDCPAPNTNCVYLSYLDSVKYFRPEVSAVPPKGMMGPTYSHDIALRTYVYHQILIGYLSYIKMLGYEQMYIWACPPMQGDDYILYCHPHKQKTPRSDRLRAWYLDMIRLAKLEGIVVHHTTLWDTYFPGGKDHRLERCSATHIPYLEGDYFPGEVENQLASLQDNQRQANKNSGAKGSQPSRASKGKRYGCGPASTDELLMDKLGEVLGGNMKEDFIVVHLQEACTFCRRHMPGGDIIYRYKSASGQPLKAAPERKFEGIKLEPGPNVPTAPVTALTICEQCYAEECVRHQSGLKSRLPAAVSPLELVMEKLEVQEPARVKDPDPDCENEFFETRQSFLSLCQGNHYQFDTLRRAKHSSMMVLYHLHNPSEPAFASTCNLCQRELEAGSGFRCTVCQDFDICVDCKNFRGHEHPLVPSRHYDETRMRMTDAERRERSETMARTMALLVHACACNNAQCSSTSCRKVRALFQHAVQCPLRLNGCATCKKMWCLLSLHAKSCTKSDCQVPRCKEIKEMRRRQMTRQEEQRRLAYQAMLRNQHMLQQKGH